MLAASLQSSPIRHAHMDILRAMGYKDTKKNVAPRGHPRGS